MLQSKSYAQESPIEEHPKIRGYVELYLEFKGKDLEKTLEVGQAMLAYTKQEVPEEVSYSYNLVGLAFESLGEYDSALFYYQGLLERATKMKDSLYISKANNNIGVVHFYTNEYDIAMDYLIRSAKIDRDMGNVGDAITSYQNVGAVMIALGRLDTAEVILNEALELGLKQGDKSTLAHIYTNIGALNYKLSNKDPSRRDLANDYFYRAINLYKAIGDYSKVSLTYRNLAENLQLQEEFILAISYDQKSLEYARKVNSPVDIQDAYLGLSQSYAGKNDYRQALENQILAAEWKDTVNHRKNQEAIIEMQEKYQSEQAKKENRILQQQNAIANLANDKSENELANSRIVIWSSVAGLILLLGLAITLFNRSKVKQKANDELTLANNIIQEKNEDITSSLEYASKIQEALLPTKENTTLFSDSLFLLKPKDIVSGDFFWYTEHNGKKIFTAVDCTGHGVPGAFMSMIGNTFLHEIINEKGITQPAEILNELREKIITALASRDARKDGMDMALCTLDESTMTLEYAGANNPLWYVQNGEIHEIKANKQPVGYMPEKNGPFTNHKISIEKGDQFYVFSDGYPDQFGGPKGKKFKYKQLREMIHQISAKPMSEQKEILLNTFHEWKGDLEQIDDVCLVGVTV